VTYEIQDSKEHHEFATGARRDTQENKGRFDLLPWEAIQHLAIHYEKGAKKYADRNWEKGLPVSRFMSSGIRHAGQFINGETDENHLIAAIWNLICAYQTVLWIQAERLPKDLYDLPRLVQL